MWQSLVTCGYWALDMWLVQTAVRCQCGTHTGFQRLYTGKEHQISHEYFLYRKLVEMIILWKYWNNFTFSFGNVLLEHLKWHTWPTRVACVVFLLRSSGLEEAAGPSPRGVRGRPQTFSYCDPKSPRALGPVHSMWDLPQFPHLVLPFFVAPASCIPCGIMPRSHSWARTALAWATPTNSEGASGIRLPTDQLNLNPANPFSFYISLSSYTSLHPSATPPVQIPIHSFIHSASIYWASMYQALFLVLDIHQWTKQINPSLLGADTLVGRRTVKNRHCK